MRAIAAVRKNIEVVVCDIQILQRHARKYRRLLSDFCCFVWTFFSASGSVTLARNATRMPNGCCRQIPMRCKPWSPNWQRRAVAQHSDQNSIFVAQDYPNEPRAAIEQAVSTVLSAIVALEGIPSQDQQCARDYSIACPSGDKPLWRVGTGCVNSI